MCGILQAYHVGITVYSKSCLQSIILPCAVLTHNDVIYGSTRTELYEYLRKWDKGEMQSAGGGRNEGQLEGIRREGVEQGNNREGKDKRGTEEMPMRELCNEATQWAMARSCA